MGPVDVSVIIVNFNTYGLTYECIRSVLEKTEGINFEIILVDNASTESDPEVFKHHFPMITLLKSPVNIGFSRGNNLGIKIARGEFILLLNSDVVLKNNAVGLCFERIKSDNSVGALTCKLFFPNGSVQPTVGRFPSLKKEIFEFLRLTKGLKRSERSDYYLGSEFSYDKEKEVDWIWGSFFMFPSKILSYFKDHLLPDDYFMYVEDILWCYKIKKLGYRILFSPMGEAYHHMSGSSKEVEPEFIRYKNKILPNEHNFIYNNFGKLYVRFYYFFRCLKHLSLRTKSDLLKAKVFFLYALK